ncbi:MAG: hypothetical protein ACT4PV_10330 [Planctomycetaceae bacterium]
MADEPGFVERVHGASEKVAAFFAGLACLGAGLICASGAFGIAGEIPAHRPIGIGLATFGALLLLVVALHGRKGRRARAAERRARSLLLGILGAGVAVAGLLVFGPELRAAWVLSDRGVATTATIVRVAHKRSKTESFAVATVSYDGHSGEVRVPFGSRPGQAVQVLYAPDDPAIVLPGGAGGGFLDLLDRRPGHGTALLMALLTLFGGVGALVCFKDFLAGAPPQ